MHADCPGNGGVCEGSGCGGRRRHGGPLVARKGCFGLPTACPSCLPVYLYLRFANAAFNFEFDVNNPDSNHVPYVECGDAVIFNNEKGDAVGEMVQSETPRKKMQRSFSNVPLWSDDNQGKKLYIVLISLHGLVRGDNMELGRDSDTGGQVKYVVELAQALSMMPGCIGLISSHARYHPLMLTEATESQPRC